MWIWPRKTRFLEVEGKQGCLFSFSNEIKLTKVQKKGTNEGHGSIVPSFCLVKHREHLQTGVNSPTNSLGQQLSLLYKE